MNLPNTAKLIKGSINHWIDIDGSVYAYDTRFGHNNILIKKSQSEVYGYKYCGIKYENKNHIVSKRVHRLVAEAFIPNPNNYNIVGHKNNIKNDNRVENLYWTTTKENTQKAFDDGLIKNDKGYEDSQSYPVNMYDTKTNKLIKQFGSICAASQETGIAKNTISRQAKYKRPVRKPYYFRFQDDADVRCPDTIGMFDFNTDELINTFINCSDASKQTGISEKTIVQQVINNRKPKKYTSSRYYFLKLSSK